jgi:hypothetical protein
MFHPIGGPGEKLPGHLERLVSSDQPGEERRSATTAVTRDEMVPRFR